MDQDLLKQYKLLHKQRPYGMSSSRMSPEITRIARDFGATSILDYGCGQSVLYQHLIKAGFQVGRYDPCVEGLETKPDRRFDMVNCTDVLEHIREADLVEVLEDLRTYANKHYFVIALSKAGQILPSGENAHCTVYPKNWWVKLLDQFFDTVEECGPITGSRRTLSVKTTYNGHSGLQCE